MGEGSANALSVATGALLSGTYVDRFTQLSTHHPMETAVEAFSAGDGSWTTTATGTDGKVNPSFVFGYPPNWIGTLDQRKWDWRKDYWKNSSVKAAVQEGLDEMYATLNANVSDIKGFTYSIANRADSGFDIVQDPRLVPQMMAICGFNSADKFSEPLNLHSSDRDFYSFVSCNRVNDAGGNCNAFVYPGNTHELEVAEEKWFSPPGTVAGFPTMVRRDLALTVGADPNAVK